MLVELPTGEWVEPFQVERVWIDSYMLATGGDRDFHNNEVKVGLVSGAVIRQNYNTEAGAKEALKVILGILRGT